VDQVDGHDTPGDDLQLIKGVGPAIEKTLNEMGIRRFDQIAQMSEYDIDRVANRLKGFRSRIYREDWIGQARDLYDQKVSGQQ
jgi:predicted flap endonuclease-1-like 5' DNA nuclease